MHAQRPSRWSLKRSGWLLGLLLGLLAALPAMPSFAAPAQASPPPPTRPQAGIVATDPARANAEQDPKFVALKRAHRINPGITKGQAKGTQSHPYVMAAPKALDAPAPAILASTTTWPTCTYCGELNPQYTLNVWEPGPGDYNGGWPNFGPNTPGYDDNGVPGHHYNDFNFYDLCGPGAADVTLFFWPAPHNYANVTATDPWNVTTTYWAGQDPYDGIFRMRGYLVNLAWNIHAPTWPNNVYKNGVLVNGLMQGGTSTLDSQEKDALNWEASGENTSNWQSYFYIQAFPGPNGEADLHTDVRDDIGYGVPVVALLNANAGLPNWPSGGITGHYVTIIGYNDDAGEYAYVDTCGQSTGCNGYGNNSDGGVHTVARSVMFNAIASYGADWIW